ncbi:hypothetical protein BH09GEM1_BH09GEM1_01690 [soil metagenome]
MNRNPRQPVVLYVDYSIGFGGSGKSLSMVMPLLTGISQLVITSQDPALARSYFPSVERWSFRRVVNYRSKERLLARAPGGVAGWLTQKVFAMIDLVAWLANSTRLTLLLLTKRVDLLHLNNGFIPREAFTAARIARVPVVVHLRGFYEDGRLIEAGTYQRVSRVIAVSDAVGESLRGTGIPRSRITTIYDPVDASGMMRAAAERARIRAAHGISDHEVLIGIFGRIVEWKGQVVFAQAAVEAMRQNGDVRAIIVGDASSGSGWYLESLRAFVASSGFATKFTFTGFQPNVEAHYAAVDIVVHASTSPEPFGMVVPEAMAAGRPIIATDAGGPREVIEQGIDGVLVPLGSVMEMTAAMTMLASDSALRKRMGAAGRVKAHELFNTERCAKSVSAVYDALLSPR